MEDFTMYCDIIIHIPEFIYIIVIVLGEDGWLQILVQGCFDWWSRGWQDLFGAKIYTGIYSCILLEHNLSGR